MAEVEGEGWRNGSEEDMGEYSVGGAIEWLKNPEGNNFVIYGRSGVNRWIVKKDGTVLFSSHHRMSEEDENKARQLGFGITHPRNL